MYNSYEKGKRILKLERIVSCSGDLEIRKCRDRRSLTICLSKSRREGARYVCTDIVLGVNIILALLKRPERLPYTSNSTRLQSGKLLAESSAHLSVPLPYQVLQHTSIAYQLNSPISLLRFSCSPILTSGPSCVVPEFPHRSVLTQTPNCAASGVPVLLQLLAQMLLIQTSPRGQPMSPGTSDNSVRRHRVRPLLPH